MTFADLLLYVAAPAAVVYVCHVERRVARQRPAREAMTEVEG